MDINVTKPFLPSRQAYQTLVDQIWSRNWLTNNGPLLNRLEIELRQFLGLDKLLVVTNGTLALQLAIKALGLQGEVITTPFSYVATTSSIVWEGCRPVMVDIEPDTLNIDPARIEAAITPATTAILATHVFGNPCETDAIGAIAARHGLKVIYDAAHAFGVRLHGRSIFAEGDVSTASFHATKLFHTIEGGAVVARTGEIDHRLSLLRNFGHTSAVSFDGPGINAKASEFHAAMGLCNLPHVTNLIAARKTVAGWYAARLEGSGLVRQRIRPQTEYNYAYMPVIFQDEAELLRVLELLANARIFPRRYFYPALSTLDYVEPRHPVPVAEDISRRILCLPLYHDLSEDEVVMICRLIRQAISR